MKVRRHRTKVMYPCRGVDYATYGISTVRSVAVGALRGSIDDMKQRKLTPTIAYDPWQWIRRRNNRLDWKRILVFHLIKEHHVFGSYKSECNGYPFKSGNTLACWNVLTGAGLSRSQQAVTYNALQNTVLVAIGKLRDATIKLKVFGWLARGSNVKSAVIKNEATYINIRQPEKSKRLSIRISRPKDTAVSQQYTLQEAKNRRAFNAQVIATANYSIPTQKCNIKAPAQPCADPLLKHMEKDLLIMLSNLLKEGIRWPDIHHLLTYWRIWALE